MFSQGKSDSGSNPRNVSDFLVNPSPVPAPSRVRVAVNGLKHAPFVGRPESDRDVGKGPDDEVAALDVFAAGFAGLSGGVLGEGPALEIESACGLGTFETFSFFDASEFHRLTDGPADERSAPRAPVFLFKPCGALVLIHTRTTIGRANLFDADFGEGGVDQLFGEGAHGLRKSAGADEDEHAMD
jgi:hypothetical protein